jgi:hypothetical protein
VEVASDLVEQNTEGCLTEDVPWWTSWGKSFQSTGWTQLDNWSLREPCSLLCSPGQGTMGVLEDYWKHRILSPCPDSLQGNHEW